MAFAFLYAKRNKNETYSFNGLLKFEDHLPSGVNAGRFGLVQSRRAVVLVETNNQRTNAERADTTALCIPLLHASNILGDVFDGDGVLDSETVRLGL